MIGSRADLRILESALNALADMPDIDRALGTLLKHVRDAMDAPVAYVLQVDGDRLSLQAGQGIAAQVGWVPRAGSIEGHVVQRGQPILIGDASSASPFLFGALAPTAFAAVPMIVRRECVGALAVARPGRQFGPDEQAWLSAVAEIVAIAIENARLLRNERRRVERAEVISTLSSLERTDLVGFCQRMAHEVVRLLDVDTTDVMLIDESSRELVRLGAGAATPAPFPSGMARIRLSDAGPLQQAFLTGKSYLWHDRTPRALAPAEIASQGMHAVFAVPIPGHPVARGLLIVARRRPQPFENEDEAFLRLVAARIGLLLHQAEVERTRAQNTARQEFLAVVSHELKTPLSVIRAYAEALQRRVEDRGHDGDPEDTTRVLRRIQEQADHTLAMISQILDLQRLEAGLLTIEESRFDLSLVTRRLVEEMQPMAQRHALTVDTPAPVLVVADRRRIEQVISNLIDNAVKYSPNGGRVHVVVEMVRDTEPPRVRLSVTDEGIGIAAEDQPRVFDRFFQGRQHTFRGRGGLGIGLFIANEIVQRHGGQIRVTSQPGRGSTFSFTLPAVRPPELP